MKLLLSITVLMVATKSSIFSQNLVPNGSSEEFSGCPGGQGDIAKATPWNDQPYDYLYAPLSEALRAGERYCVSMWVSCADQPRMATDDLCIFFTSEVPSVETLDTLT